MLRTTLARESIGATIFEAKVFASKNFSLERIAPTFNYILYGKSLCGCPFTKHHHGMELSALLHCDFVLMNVRNIRD